MHNMNVCCRGICLRGRANSVCRTLGVLDGEEKKEYFEIHANLFLLTYLTFICIKPMLYMHKNICFICIIHNAHCTYIKRKENK